MLENLLKMAEDQNFPDKEFYISSTKSVKYYSPVLHFFEQRRVYDHDSQLKETTNACCRLCEQCLTILTFPKFSNLYKHLKNNKSKHELFFKWYKYYEVRKGKRLNQMNEQLFTLTQYICSSNLAIIQLENPFLLKMITPFLGMFFLVYFLSSEMIF